MSPQDLALIEHLSDTHPELPRLLEQHRDYETLLEDLERRRWLSAEEQVERARLKRLKLRGRDRMEALLAPHRSPAA
jgi:uncharacterized protein YdcH (DUF465 family)